MYEQFIRVCENGTAEEARRLVLTCPGLDILVNSVYKTVEQSNASKAQLLESTSTPLNYFLRASAGIAKSG